MFIKDTPTLNLGKECVIPFEYQNVSFNYCTNKDGIFQCAIDDSFETFDECNTGQYKFFSQQQKNLLRHDLNSTKI